MSILSKLHAKDETELSKFAIIESNDYISIAIYHSTADKLGSFVHNHDHYEFIIPTETIPVLAYEDANYIGEVGYCFPVNPFVKHGLTLETDSELIRVVVDREYLDEIKKELGYEGKYFYTRFLLETRIIFLINLFVMFKSDELTKQIVTEIVSKGLMVDKDTRKKPATLFKYFKEVIIYMCMHYQEPDLTIAKLSKMFKYKNTYFTKAFVKFMGETPIYYLNRLRISKAKELMKNNNLSLDEISSSVGYRNSSSFTEAFKRIIGMLPKEYRKKYLRTSS